MVKLRAMFPRKIKVCDAFGIPVYLDFSLIILLILFATSGGPFILSMACALMLLVSITAHELGHALTARAFGYGTRDITLSLLGGCASLIALPRKAWQEFFTAIAGPMVSFTISILALSLVASLTTGNVIGFAFYRLSGGWFGTPQLVCDEKVFWIVDLLLDIGLMNLMLGMFNLLPGFPMDGGRVFRSAMRAVMSRARATYVAMIVGRGVAILLGLWGLSKIVNRGSWGFVTILIAWMIWREGWREYQMARMEESARGWGNDWSARVSPPPYGGHGDEVEIRED